MKKCECCLTLKPLTAYGRVKSVLYANPKCKACNNAIMRELRLRKRAKWASLKAQIPKDALWFMVEALRPLELEFVRSTVSFRCIFDVHKIECPDMKAKAAVWCLVFDNGDRGIFVCVDGWLNPVMDRDLRAIAKHITKQGYRIAAESNAEFDKVPELPKIDFDFRNHGVQLFWKQQENKVNPEE